MKNSDEIWRCVDDRATGYFTLSDRIWDEPELNYAERRAADGHAAMLEAEGFRVERAICGLPTAVMGEAGQGGPVIAFLGEYDALPGLSQAAGVAERRELVKNGSGHGCGHNMLGSAALLAAAALKQWLAEHNVAGRVRYYGCPAEEGGSSKGFMVREGAFDDVDLAICWHPACFSGVNPPVSLACVEIDFTFEGRAAHAAAAPHLGRSALDAVELMNIGVNYMREHMPSSARVHYAIVDAGGIAPNVVQARATVRHLIRAATLGEMWDLVARVKKIADGAALMSETRVAVRQVSGDANLVGNRPLEEAMHNVMLRLGPPRFDEADRAFAREIQTTLGRDDILASYARFDLEPRFDEPLNEAIYPLGSGGGIVGSTDVGTVSWVTPTVQCRAACYAVGTPAHSWQLVAQGKAPAAHKGLAWAAKVMAGTAVEALRDASLLAAAKADFDAFRARNPFRNPVGDIAPPLEMANL